VASFFVVVRTPSGAVTTLRIPRPVNSSRSDEDTALPDGRAGPPPRWRPPRWPAPTGSPCRPLRIAMRHAPPAAAAPSAIRAGNSSQLIISPDYSTKFGPSRDSSYSLRRTRDVCGRYHSLPLARDPPTQGLGTTCTRSWAALRLCMQLLAREDRGDVSARADRFGGSAGS